MTEGQPLSLRGAVTLLNELFYRHDPETAKKLHAGQDWLRWTRGGQPEQLLTFESDPERSRALVETLGRIMDRNFRPGEIDALRSRFSDDTPTFRHMGEERGRTRASMSLLTNKGLKKLRHPSRLRHLVPFLATPPVHIQLP